MYTRILIAKVLLITFGFLASPPLAAQSPPTALVLSGAAAPAGGNYGPFPTSGSAAFLPIISEAGRVEFYPQLVSGTSTGGLFVGTPGTIQIVALQGTPAPAGGNFTSSFSDLRQNAAGQVAFSCSLSSGGQGLFVGLPGALQTVALDGTPSPGGGGNYNSGFSSPLFNAAGRVTFVVNLTGGSATTGLFSGVPGSVQAVALQGSPTPAGGSYTTGFSNSLNNSGQLVFSAGTTGIAATSGLFFGTPGSLQTVALQGTAAPSGGNYSSFVRPVINDAGQIAFSALLTGGSASTGVFAGVPGSLQTVALQGSAAPAGGNYVSFLAPALLNSAGQIAFRANLTGGSATSGIFVGTAGSLQATVLQGSPAPGGGTFSLFNFAPQLNGLGQVAFLATLTGAGVNTTNDIGLYAGSPGSLLKIVREGDIIDVNPGPGIDLRTVSGIGFRGEFNDVPSGGQDGRGLTFTTSGYISYDLAFTDGSSGVFFSNIAAVPEPTTILLTVLLVLVASLAWWHRSSWRCRELESECSMPDDA